VPESFIERIKRFMGLLADTIRKRIGLIRVYRIYCYEVRVSGYVIPPKPVRRKDFYKPYTCIQFELSFEERPYFRTLISNFKDAKERYEKELEYLVKEQEQRAVREFAFNPTEKVEASKYPDLVRKFLRVASREDLEMYELSGGKYIKIPGRPEFVIEAIDFEEVEYFDVEEGKLKEFKALDDGIFKLYRPYEEEVPYMQWRVPFLHDLS